MASHSLVVLREHSEPEVEPDFSVAASVAARAEPGNQSSTRSRRHG
jgi:glycogen operon protein